MKNIIYVTGNYGKYVSVKEYFDELLLMEKQYGQEEELYPWIYMLLKMAECKKKEILGKEYTADGIFKEGLNYITPKVMADAGFRVSSEGSKPVISLSTVKVSVDGEEKEIIVRELERKYYTPSIKKILSVKDRFGFSYWDVETESGKVTFTLQDTFKSISRAGDNKLFFSDVDGNRFVIENIEALDRKSHKKIELYL